MLKEMESDEQLIPLTAALERFQVFQVVDSRVKQRRARLGSSRNIPASTHLTGAVTRLIAFPEGTWAEIEIDDAPPLYNEFRVQTPIHNGDGTITRLFKGQRVNILVKPRGLEPGA